MKHFTLGFVLILTACEVATAAAPSEPARQPVVTREGPAAPASSLAEPPAEVLSPSAAPVVPASASSTSGPTATSCPAEMAMIPGGMLPAQVEGGRPERVADFCLDLAPVSVRAFNGCVMAGDCTKGSVATRFTAGKEQGQGACNWGVAGREDHPQNCVDWATATAYCESARKRLPTQPEAVWAARGGDEARKHPWGAAAPLQQLCWSGVTKRDSTCPIADGVPGRWGLRHMVGNVQQWTSTEYGATAMMYFASAGFGGVGASLAESKARSWGDPLNRLDYAGFRCAR
jgi:formylglycine-generating enzyme